MRRAGPISRVVDASRGLMHDDVVAREVLLALAEAAVLTALFVPVTPYRSCG